MSIRINKYISEAGICSRREADRKIEMGKVRLNGKLATLGDTVGPGDKVLVDGNPIQSSMQRIYLAYNKPVGVTSTTDKSDPDNIIKAVAYHGGRIFPIGRLDKDSDGLIILTNDGDVVNKILRVSNKHDKEYIVSVDKVITDEFIKKMSGGVPILDVVTRKCTVEKINQNTFKIILNQGLNRQIRRMCKVLGYKVLRLQRVRIMHISVDGISKGTWRFLTDDEINTLLSAVVQSKSEPERLNTKPFTKTFAKKVKKPGKWNSEETKAKSTVKADKRTSVKASEERGGKPLKKVMNASKPVKGSRPSEPDSETKFTKSAKQTRSTKTSKSTPKIKSTRPAKGSHLNVKGRRR
jgi:23S rRNA pseudouridine2604 synthase